MNARIVLLTSSLFLSLCGVVAGKPIRDTAEKVRPNTEHQAGKEFESKYVAIVTKTKSAGAVLEEVRVRKLAAKVFLVGKRVTPWPSRWSGVVTWIPVDDIEAVYEFNSIADLDAAHAEASQASPAAPPNGTAPPSITPSRPAPLDPTLPPPPPMLGS